MTNQPSILNQLSQGRPDLKREDCIERESKCKLVIDVNHPRVIMDGNKLAGDDYPVCDCLIFIEHSGLEVVVAECKDKIRDAGHAINQLSNGWLEVEKMISKCDPCPKKLECYAIILTNHWNRKVDKTRARRAKIRMRGKRSITLGKCGEKLSKLIPDV
ncbi:MAG: hypothetical protein JW941_12720 [Candidatus Coatesbacteria bacterium]|nr:hypothetical protein [Candidatus Coatesbacteria bacterium]